MTTDYTVASLPALAFGTRAPISRKQFLDAAPEAPNIVAKSEWPTLETQLRNAMAAARGGAKYVRPTQGCSIYWRDRVTACFQEKDVARRDEMLDRVWWDAAGELTSPSDPLGKGALATYAVRLDIALRRSAISKDAGNAAFDRLTAATRPEQG